MRRFEMKPIILCLILLVATVCIGVSAEDDEGKLGLTRGVRATDPCTETKRLYHSKGFTQAVPNFAIKGTDLRVCSQSYTCCTEEMEDQLKKRSVSDFENKVSEKGNFMKDLFVLRHNKFNVFFKELIENAKKSLHDLFEQTYGDLYTDNSEVFMHFFDELTLYYDGAVVDMNDIFDRFFTTLMQQVFKLLNPSYDIDDDYMQCIADNINIIKPFADLPQTLSNQVRRAFIAARTFVQGLETGQQVAEKISKIYPTTECAKALMKMTYCSECNGYNVIKPCHNMCLNVMKGCLCNLGENSINNVWNFYIRSMMQLLDRLEGPFNIESVLDPIDVKISEAIMTLQDNEIPISSTVSRQCGHLSQKKNFTLGFGGSFMNFGMAYNPSKPSGKGSRGMGQIAGLSNIDFSKLTEDLSSDTDLDFGLSQTMSYKPGRPGGKGSKGLGRIPGLSNIDLSKLSEDLTSDMGISKRSVDEDMEGDMEMKKDSKGKKNKRNKRRRRRRRNRNRKGRHQPRDVSGEKQEVRLSLMSGDRYKNPLIKPNQPSRLESLVGEMRLTENDMKNFWKNLPVTVCTEAADEQDVNCWNGVSTGMYSLSVTKDGLENQQHNPEVSVNVSQLPDLIIRQQVAVLHEVTVKLRHAYNGVDPALEDSDDTMYSPVDEMPIDEEIEEEYVSGDYSGEGSGEEEEGQDAHEKGRGKMPFNMAKTEGLYVEDLETWQIKLVEQVLGEKVAPRTSLTTLQERLAQHPDLDKIQAEVEEKSGKEGKKKNSGRKKGKGGEEVFGDLKRSRQREIEKKLEKTIDSKTSMKEVEALLKQHDKEKMAVTEVMKTTTTSNSFIFRPSTILFTLVTCVAYFRWNDNALIL